MQYISSPREAELNAAKCMRQLGYADATATAPGADGGIDVRASGAVAQVKWEAHQTGRPTVQNLYGARGRDHDLDMLFFSSSSYSSHALAYADEVGIALFTYDPLGSITAANSHAETLVLRESETRALPMRRDAAASAAPFNDAAGRRPDSHDGPDAPLPAARTDALSPWRGTVSDRLGNLAPASPSASGPQKESTRGKPPVTLAEVVPTTANEGSARESRAERRRAKSEAQRQQISDERGTRRTIFEKLGQKDLQLSAAADHERTEPPSRKRSSPFLHYLRP